MTSLLAPTAAALLLPGAPTDDAALQRTLHRQGAALAATLCITLATPAPALAGCELACFKECNKVVPGSGAYCTSTCSSYCEEQAALRAVKEGIYQHHPGAPDDGVVPVGERPVSPAGSHAGSHAGSVSTSMGNQDVVLRDAPLLHAVQPPERERDDDLVALELAHPRRERLAHGRHVGVALRQQHRQVWRRRLLLRRRLGPEERLRRLEDG